MAYPGLETLFQNLGPTAASMSAGQQFGQAQLNAQADNDFRQQQIQEALLKNKLTEATMPYDIDQKRLGVNKLQEELPGVTADALVKRLAAENKSATNASDIATSIAKNNSIVLGEKLKQSEYTQTMLNDLIPRLQATPPAARHSVLMEYSKSNNLPMTPEDMAHFQSMPSEQLPKYLADARDHAIKTSAAYQTELMKQLQHLEGIKETGKNQTNVANIYATSRVNAANAKAVPYINMLSKLSPDKRLGAVQGILVSGMDPETNELLTEEQRKIYQAIYNQDVNTINASNAAKDKGGIVPQTGPDGITLENRPAIPSVGKQTNLNRKPLSQY